MVVKGKVVKSLFLVLIVVIVLIILFYGIIFYYMVYDYQPRPILAVARVNNSYSNSPVSPISNLTRSDIAGIPILVQAIDEGLAGNSTFHRIYEITQQVYDQIAQLFDELDLPFQKIGERESTSSWYISFAGTVLDIRLSYYLS